MVEYNKAMMAWRSLWDCECVSLGAGISSAWCSTALQSFAFIYMMGLLEHEATSVQT